MAQATRERRRARRPQQELEEQQPDQDRDEGGGDAPTGGAVAQLREVMSEAAVSVLAPVAKKLATSAAKLAVEKGPGLLEETILPKLQDAGSLFGGGGGGDDDDDQKGAGDGTGKGRRMPIQQAVDVGAPLDVVYDQFTQFEDFPKFMHRVERAERHDDSHVVFHEKIWGIRRQWEAEIVEERPDERLVWKTVNGMQHTGVVTFHELSDSLTRIELNIDIDPEGPLEKIARGARFAKRAARADLKRFKAYVEMHEGELLEEYEDEQDEDEEERQSARAASRTKSNGGRSQSRSRAKPKPKPKPKPRAKASSGKRSK